MPEQIVQAGGRGMRAAQDDHAQSRANGNEVRTMKGYRAAGVEGVPAGRPLDDIGQNSLAGQYAEQ